jgi:outer membrane protein OmpA-like peptidoglycan-associated protein
MLGDAHWTNFAENREFFMVASNPTNFERTFNTAYYLYRQLPGDVVTEPFVSFDSVMDFSVIKKLMAEPKYANQKNTYDMKFSPASADAIQAESPEILTKTVKIHFFPNSDDVNKTVTRHVDGKDVVVPYDPNVRFVVEEIGKLAGQYGAAQIVIEGHTDASMKGRVSPNLVKSLSSRRAEAVKKAVATKFPSLDPNQFSVKGWGWDKPAQAGNHGKNRRVEVKVYPAEAGTQ